MKITSRQNNLVKYWSNLKNKRFRDQEKRFLIEGDHLINEARKHNLVDYVISLDESKKDVLYTVSKEVMEKISDQKSISRSVAVVKFLEEKEIRGNVVILDNLQDPGNLGTIIRSAVAFGIDTIILSEDSVDLYNPKVVRSTEGMIFNINILKRNLSEFVPKLKSNGYKIVGTDVVNGSNIKDITCEKVALIIGNEGNGMNNQLKTLCDEFVYISMNKNCESLNASVSASILMYEVYNG